MIVWEADTAAQRRAREEVPIGSLRDLSECFWSWYTFKTGSRLHLCGGHSTFGFGRQRSLHSPEQRD